MAQKPDRVINVYSHPKDGWRVVYVKDGAKRTKARRSRSAADQLAAKLALELTGREVVGATVDIDMPTDKGLRRGEWTRVLWDLTVAAMRAPADEDRKSLLRAAASAANAAAKFIDDAELKARLDFVEREIERIRHRRIHADPSAKHAPHITTIDPDDIN